MCVFFFLPGFSAHTPKCQQLSSCRISCLDQPSALLLLSYDVAQYLVAITSFKLLKSVESGLFTPYQEKTWGGFSKNKCMCVFFFLPGFSTHTPKCQQLSSCEISCLDQPSAILLLSYDAAQH